MSTADPNHVISINITKFPQNLLIPDVDNIISFQVINQSKKEEHFKFVFEGENLEIDVQPAEFLTEVLFKAGETKKIKLLLKPTADGFGKLIVNAYWMKVVEVIVKVQKIREKISSSKIKQILKGKQFLSFGKSDGFNPKEFINSSKKNEIKKIEKEISELANKSVNGQNNGRSIKELNKQYESNLILLAKSYLSNGEFYKALETSLKLTNESEKLELYYNLIRANASLNLESSLQLIDQLNDLAKKNEIAKKIALDYVKTNPDQVRRILSFIAEESKKNDAFLEVIFIALERDANLALKFSEHIKDEIAKVKVLFNIIKKLHEINDNAAILTIVNQINDIILNSKIINIADQNYRNPAYEYFKEAVCILAELDCPEAADKLIGGLESDELKKNVAKDLFKEVYKMVDEKQTKVEPIGEFSQFYLLNTLTSNITREVNEFAQLGGNVSRNILSGNYNFPIALLSLFSYDFSIFPVIDRVFSEISYNAKNAFSYYIYPSISEHNQEELQIILSTLKKFFQPGSIKNRVTIFNLDFVPFLGKPTIILSSMNNDLSAMKSKIVKSLGDRVDIIIDEDLFKGGKTVESLSTVFYSNNFNIVNLVLSYEFINDYELFRMFIQSLI